MFGALESINATRTVNAHVHAEEATCHPVHVAHNVFLIVSGGQSHRRKSYTSLLLHRQHLLGSIHCWFGSFIGQKYGISLALSCKVTGMTTKLVFFL